MTAALAILADGQRTGAQAAQLAQSERSARKPAGEAETQTGFVVTDEFADGSYGGESGPAYGQPTTRVPNSGGSVRSGLGLEGDGRRVRMTAPTGYGIHGLTQEELAQMSDAERGALEALLNGAGPPDSVTERKKQTSNLRHASLARSGAENSDDF